MSASVIWVGVCQSAFNGTAEGANVSQAPSSAASAPPPFHGALVEALRPAWPSWMPMGVSL